MDLRNLALFHYNMADKKHNEQKGRKRNTPRDGHTPAICILYGYTEPRAQCATTPMVAIPSYEGNDLFNQFLLIDDLTLVAQTTKTSRLRMTKQNHNLMPSGLITFRRLAIGSQLRKEDARIFYGMASYKCSGIIKNQGGEPYPYQSDDAEKDRSTM